MGETVKKPKLSARKIHHLTGCSLLALALAIAGSSIAAAADADPAAQGTPAQTAQAQPARSDELETVTVSARYQTENLQQTPISISAITADDLEKKGFTNLTDISKQVPNLKLDPAGAAFGSSAAVFIRGVGQADFHPALDPGVGIYIDGIYYGSLYGDQLDLSDTESVTVLRGPQGTLFGRNTEGGAVLISTVKPKGDNSGYVEVGYGSYNQEQAKGAFDVSVIPDKLAIRVAAGVNSVDGYVDLIDFACANPAATAALNAKNAGAPRLGAAESHDDGARLRHRPTRRLNYDKSPRLHADYADGRSSDPADGGSARYPRRGAGGRHDLYQPDLSRLAGVPGNRLRPDLHVARPLPELCRQHESRERDQLPERQ